ncbi:MAG: hypothetical protein Q9227_007049 [Pyrenula ochraceoflavens]
MSTVILGGGIIGTATAYYLSHSPSYSPSKTPIHIVEASPEPFTGASGYAAGFLAKDWFSPAVASLGALSFKLHKELAEQNEGKRKWGYSPSTALSLALSNGVGIGKGERGEDWLRDGTSRAEVAPSEAEVVNDDGTPRWLTKQPGGSLDIISEEDTAAQVDPKRLCTFLLDECRKKGVTIHLNSSPTSLSHDTSGRICGVTISTSSSLSTKTETIPASTLLLTAGPWTPSLFRTLFPTSQLRIPITSLAGHSLVLRSPRHPTPDPSTTSSTSTTSPSHSDPQTHAIFSAPSPQSGINFSPEIFSRTGASSSPSPSSSNSSSSSAAEIYIAGLNSQTLPLPPRADQAQAQTDPSSLQELHRVAVQLLGGHPATAGDVNINDLEILREGVCFRPVSRSGRPIIARVPAEKLGVEMADEGGGVFVSAGHGPWGISLSLGTGKCLAEMVEGRKGTSADVSGLGL